MKRLAALLLAFVAVPAMAQTAPEVRTDYVSFGGHDEGLIYRPAGAASRIALVYAHPSGNTFDTAVGREMARRGYAIMMVNHHDEDERLDAFAGAISQAIRHMRGLPGIERVVLVGHSGGGPLVAFYQNVAEHGPGACSGVEKIYPCRVDLVRDLAPADGVVLLDPTLGAFHQMSSIDPAAGGEVRDASLDMFAPGNGYDAASGRAVYPAAFRGRFAAGQARRSDALIAEARERLRVIEAGQGRFADDEPFVIRGIGHHAAGARLYQPDTSMLAHTRAPHLLLRADGSEQEGVIASVRGPGGKATRDGLRTMDLMGNNTSVRVFLATAAIRTKDFAIGADDITGVEWGSAFSSAPGNAPGISVPSLVLTMSCHYLLVPGEIIFDRLGSRDKSYAAVEGATHLFGPCKPEYGDTVKRTFDHVALWLSKPGRF